MSLDPLEVALLVAISRLTSGRVDSCDGKQIAAMLNDRGFEFDSQTARNRLQGLKRDGYLTAQSYFSFGVELDESAGPLMLSAAGKDTAREVDSDAFDGAASEIRLLISSEVFEEDFPGAYASWLAADTAVRSPDAELHIAAIGANLRAAQQKFASALIAVHHPEIFDPDPEKSKRRVGAVINLYLDDLPEARKKYLTQLGDMWEATVDLVQRLVHVEFEPGDSLPLADAYSATISVLFLMYQLAGYLEICMPIEPEAVLE